MSKELKGFTNRLQINPDGSITKFFHDDGITSKPARLRQHAEAQALSFLPNSPKLISNKQGQVVMTVLEGESDLNNKVRSMPENLQASVFNSAGKSLYAVHNQHKFPVGEEYLSCTVNDSIIRTRKIRGSLQNLSIDGDELETYFRRGLNKSEVKRHGLSISHGDYWLNNIVGKIKNNTFSVTGIVDWEMGGIESPYVDFASANLSIIEYHHQAAVHFWNGYGHQPDRSTLIYFSLRQIIIWISEDLQADFNSDFYKNKIDMIRRLV